jgi:formiminoglutamase
MAYPFEYACLGVARVANTRALFQRADQLSVRYLLDVASTAEAGGELLHHFLAGVDCLYFTCCLDVFPAHIAPGVSAPAALGINPLTAVAWIQTIGRLCREYGVDWLAADVAELSPPNDREDRTAKLAARLVDEIVSARFGSTETAST